MSRATRDAVAADTGSTPLSLGGSTTGAPMAVDPFDPAALALRLADARERRARALASRKAATDAGECAPAACEAGAAKLGFRLGGADPCAFARSDGADRIGRARPAPRPAPRIEPRKRGPRHTPRPTPGRLCRALPLRIGLGLFAVALLAAGLVLAPLQVRRDIALLIAPDLEALPGADATAATPRQPAAVLPGRGIGPGGRRDPRCNGPGPPPATAGRGSGPAVDRRATGGAEQARRDRGDRGGAAFCSVGPHATRRARRVRGPRPPAAETRPATPTPARADCQRPDRDRRAVPASVRAAGPPAEAGVSGPTAFSARQRSRGRPAEPAGDTGGAGRRRRSRRVAGSLGRPRGNGTGPGGVPRGRTGVSFDVPGASASGRIRVRFQPSEAATQVGADVWFPGDPRLAAARDFVGFSLQPDPAGMKQPPAGSRKAAPRAEPARKAPVRLAAPRAASAQAQRAKLEQEVEAMLKVRLRDLRRR